MSVDRAKDNADSDLFLSYLLNLVPRLCEISHGENLQVGTKSIAVDRFGQVTGFSATAFEDIHLTTSKMLMDDS